MNKDKNSDALRKAMQQAQQHIKKGEYDKGRAILEKIDAKVDNPTVKKWLAQLDKIAPKDDLFGDMEFPDVKGKPAQVKGKGMTRTKWIVAGFFMLCMCSVCATIRNDKQQDDAILTATRAARITVSDTPRPTNVDAKTNTPTPTATITNTATMTNTPMPTNTATVTHTSVPTPTSTALPQGNEPDAVLTRNIYTISGVRGTELVSVDVRDGMIYSYAEILIELGTDYNRVADDYMQSVSQLSVPGASGLADVFAIIDDGITAISYNFDFRRGIWNADEMTSFNAERAASNPNNIRPENCDEAMAMGLSAEQAGQWEHLDRDGDGVACEGN